MPNFTAGTSFTDGVTNDVTAAKLNALIADAVPTSSLSLNSTTGTIANFSSSTANITNGTITTLTNGTTTATAEVITSGTIGTLNSTTGTIGNLSTTLAGDLTISQGTATLATSGATAATYGTTSDIPRITVDAKGRITSATTVTAPVGFRNRIINGDMRIDQRNAGAAVTTSGLLPVDRFAFAYSLDGTVSVQQSSVAPNNFTNSLAITVTGQDLSIGASQYFQLFQKVEGYNVADFDFGKNSAKNVTLSFWVRSSKTGIYYCSIGNDSINRIIPLQYSITSANTWEQKTITISGDTTGTWKTDNGNGMYVLWNLALGSNFNSGTNNVWGTSQWGAANQVNLFDTNGATFYITGVQLEAGSTATEFERRPYGTELALCQRYYESGGGANNSLWYGYAVNSINYYYGVSFIVTKRSTPTVYNITNIATNGFPATASSVGVITSVGMQLGRACSSTTNGAYFLDRWDASAEL